MKQELIDTGLDNEDDQVWRRHFECEIRRNAIRIPCLRRTRDGYRLDLEYWEGVAFNALRLYNQAFGTDIGHGQSTKI